MSMTVGFLFGLLLILGAVILAGTLVVGGAVMLFKLLRRPAKPSEPPSSPPPQPPAQPGAGSTGQPPRLPGA